MFTPNPDANVGVGVDVERGEDVIWGERGIGDLVSKLDWDWEDVKGGCETDRSIRSLSKPLTLKLND